MNDVNNSFIVKLSLETVIKYSSSIIIPLFDKTQLIPLQY